MLSGDGAGLQNQLDHSVITQQGRRFRNRSAFLFVFFASTTSAQLDRSGRNGRDRRSNVNTNRLRVNTKPAGEVSGGQRQKESFRGENNSFGPQRWRDDGLGEVLGVNTREKVMGV